MFLYVSLHFLRENNIFSGICLFPLKKEGTCIFVSGEVSETPNLFFGSNLFLKGLMFQNLLSKERSFTKKELFLRSKPRKRS